MLALAAQGDGSSAEEIANYKLTGVDGYATMQYVTDEQTSHGGTAARSRQAQSGWRSETFVMTQSYVYHPNLMTLELGGGPVLHSEQFSGDAGEASARGMLYNFTARATLLRDKPYNGALFFSHLNPTVSVSPGQVFTQENIRYGFDFSLLAPATPVPLQVGFLGTQSAGRGADRQIDDKIQQLNVTASKSFGKLGSTQVQFNSSQQVSNSGSENLPIQASSSRAQTINVDTRLQFGEDLQYDLANIISANSQKYTLAESSLPDLTNTRFLLDLRARHSPLLHSSGSYNYNHSSQGEIDSISQTAAANLHYWPTTGVETGFGVRGENIDTRQFSARSQGVDGNVRYEMQLPIGVAQASYGVRYDKRAQQAMTQQTTILGERLTLSGTSYAALANRNVLSGSPVLTNATRSQTFIVGVDYLLTLVGTETRLQRLIGGNILDGEQVLVDYVFDVGGTYAYHEHDQTLNLNWNFLRYVSVFYRRFSSAPVLDSGRPTFSLNEIKSSSHGLRVDFPINAGLAISFGGGVEWENRRETISPYRRMTNDYFLQSDEPIFGLGYVRASVRRSRIDYDNPGQNSDLRGYELRYWSPRWFGLDLTAALAGERDDAGLIPRHRMDRSIGLQWQMRKFTVNSSYVRTNETQGDSQRNRFSFQFLARRDL